ncbi:hypothetical protein Ciccas_008395 [Cichlidogyrus casuarinus]|uniref:SCP domain-containing protein n=1 Tax=Cichlidogyrus casuarinus TaxID=1844966 RepID=A0ABD2Q0W7_9PLAT
MGFLPCINKKGGKTQKITGKMDKKFNKDCMDEHNRLRQLHGCPPIKLSNELAKQAQNYANELASKGTLSHSAADDYGENLATRYSTGDVELTGKQATLMWYSEIKDYQFGQENQLNCGHFSQVVWKCTKEAGFGIALSPDGKKITVVGQYRPPGNYNNEWNANVPVPVSGAVYIPTSEELG